MASTIIAGDYENKIVVASGSKVRLSITTFNGIYLDKSTVESYEIVDEESKKSATSAVGRGLVGGLILGPVGLLAGLSAKKKGTYRIVINWKDGKRSLLEADDKVYKTLQRTLF